MVVDCADGGLGHEFAGDGEGLDEGVDGVEVGEFEAADGGVVGVGVEEGLAVAAVLLLS